MIVDEVQVMPARTFRTVATTVKAHCILGLTATLVREDNLIYDLHWLIGPKLYEASWQQLQEEGFIARVRCVEVWCEMTRAFFAEYLRGQDEKNEHLRRALWTCNPTKLNVCEYLIRFHENRGDKIIVFSDNIFILEEFAKQLGRYYICGKVDMRERMQILSNFADSATCNTIFLSKVGDNAIDIPNANVIIQISAHYGSRRQEASRSTPNAQPSAVHAARAPENALPSVYLACGGRPEEAGGSSTGGVVAGGQKIWPGDVMLFCLRVSGAGYAGIQHGS
ncbi:unnamed protein product [Prorocentrum cordatum]|uniref:ERCC3/RAD25/XPB helicase C-terminal domain-containing protein n=1 Tax=Prorocentrum cordatum TaxID=2364126 RepID=A0ABN9U7W0_9DINO|nr:unnamed protein product [Polarella glacialis]